VTAATAVTALLLVAHGSRDPRAERAIDRLAGRVAAARPGLPVAVATLELRGRRVAAVVADLAARGADRVVVVPLLLTDAYHGSVDLPAVLDRVRRDLPGVEVLAGPVLGPDDLLLDALDEDERASRTGFDGIVLAVAGTRDRAARAGIDRVAARYGRRHGVPCLAAHASGGGPDVGSTTRALRGLGARRILVASYFLAPGLLHDRIVAGARQAGAVAVTDPFAGTASVAQLTLRRYDRAALSVLAA
jgi:sirohydrochlorin ferrochelatase